MPGVGVRVGGDPVPEETRAGAVESTAERETQGQLAQV